jgi:predicted Zn-dependent peptidase
MSDQMLHPSFPADEFEKAKLQRKGALLGQSENTGTRARELMYQLAFPAGHPIRPVTVLERAQQVGAVTVDEVKSFYKQHYTGGSLVLAISGDVNPDSVITLVGKYFGGLPEGDAPKFDLPRVEAGAAQQKVITMKGKANMDMLYGYAGALRRTDADFYPALLANAVFGQDALTSRAGKRVRDAEGLTYNLFSRYFGSDLLEGIWVIDVAVAPQNLKKAMASTLDEYKKFAAGGITQEELDAQKGFFAGNFKVNLATNFGIATQLAFAEKFGWGPGFLDQYPKSIQAVTLQQVNDVIKRRFDPAKLNTVVAGDLEALPTP